MPLSRCPKNHRLDEQNRHGRRFFFQLDEELHELVEMEIRELLGKYDYDGDDTAVVKGSALCAANDTNPELGEK